MNDTEEFNQRIKQMQRMAWGVMLGAGAAVGLLACGAVFLIKRQRR